MLLIRDRRLPPEAAEILMTIQRAIDRRPGYEARVAAAKKEWDGKTSNKKKKLAFQSVRETLGRMCVGPVRCAYCEDSAADEIEHIHPKTVFPERAFVWSNYAFVCGPCNGPKSNRHGVVVGNEVREFRRGPRDPVVEPPGGLAALIDPRHEDPMEFLELDLGGVSLDGVVLRPTYDFVPRYDLSGAATARAAFTIDVLGLNREVLRAARKSAFSGYLARLYYYADRADARPPKSEMSRLRKEILSTPHLTVFAELRRQRDVLPEIDTLLRRVPAVLEWPVVPPGRG